MHVPYKEMQDQTPEHVDVPDRPQSKHRRARALGCITIMLILSLPVTYMCDSNLYDNTILHPLMKDEMLKVTRTWARLAPVPDSAEEFKIITKGSMFTREFNASFRAPLSDIKQWLDDSPGTSETIPQAWPRFQNDEEIWADAAGSEGLGETGVWYYEVPPADGAQFAGVWVDVKMEMVWIEAWWS